MWNLRVVLCEWWTKSIAWYIYGRVNWGWVEQAWSDCGVVVCWTKVIIDLSMLGRVWGGGGLAKIEHYHKGLQTIVFWFLRISLTHSHEFSLYVLIYFSFAYVLVWWKRHCNLLILIDVHSDWLGECWWVSNCQLINTFVLYEYALWGNDLI